jgi:hypothetical protein
MINILILFASHCFGDFAFQSDFLTKWKSKDIYILLAHCAIYTVAVAFGFLIVGLNKGIVSNIDWDWVFGVLFYSHFIIDLIKCKFRNKLYNGKEVEVDIDFMCMSGDDVICRKDHLLFYCDALLHCLIILALYMSI